MKAEKRRAPLSAHFPPLIRVVADTPHFVSCEVMPEIDDTIEIDLSPDEEIQVDTYRASGAGGQLTSIKRICCAYHPP